MAAELDGSLFFGHVSSGESYAMTLGLVNPGEGTVAATIDLYREDGSLESSTTVTVPAHQRLIEALTNYFPGLAGQNRSAGYLRVTSEIGITGFVTIKTSNQMSIFSLSAQR
jgi:hypothetical protein